MEEEGKAWRLNWADVRWGLREPLSDAVWFLTSLEQKQVLFALKKLRSLSSLAVVQIRVGHLNLALREDLFLFPCFNFHEKLSELNAQNRGWCWKIGMAR